MQSLVSDSNLSNYVYLLYLEGKRHYEVIHMILRIYLTINFPKILPFFKFYFCHLGVLFPEQTYRKNSSRKRVS